MTDKHGIHCDECNLIMGLVEPRVKFGDRDFHIRCFDAWKWKHDMAEREKRMREMRDRLKLIQKRR